MASAPIPILLPPAETSSAKVQGAPSTTAAAPTTHPDSIEPAPIRQASVPCPPPPSSLSTQPGPRRRAMLPETAFGRLPDDAEATTSKSLLRRSLVPSSSPPPPPPSSADSSSLALSPLTQSVSSSASTSLTDIASTVSEPGPSSTGPPRIPTILRAVSFAPLPMTEARARSGTLGVAGRSRLLAERRRSRYAAAAAAAASTDDEEAPPPPQPHRSLSAAARAELERLAVEDALGRLERAHAASRITSHTPALERIARVFVAGWRKLATPPTDEQTQRCSTPPTLRLAGEVRVEKASVTPDEEGHTERGGTWVEEVSPDFLALHFRHRDEAERERAKAEEAEKVTMTKSIVRRASERALRRASSALPLSTPQVIEDEDWHEKAQASPSRSHTPKPSISVPPEIVVSDAEAKSEVDNGEATPRPKPQEEEATKERDS